MKRISALAAGLATLVSASAFAQENAAVYDEATIAVRIEPAGIAWLEAAVERMGGQVGILPTIDSTMRVGFQLYANEGWFDAVETGTLAPPAEPDLEWVHRLPVAGPLRFDVPESASRDELDAIIDPFRIPGTWSEDRDDGLEVIVPAIGGGASRSVFPTEVDDRLREGTTPATLAFADPHVLGAVYTMPEHFAQWYTAQGLTQLVQAFEHTSSDRAASMVAAGLGLAIVPLGLQHSSIATSDDVAFVVRQTGDQPVLYIVSSHTELGTALEPAYEHVAIRPPILDSVVFSMDFALDLGEVIQRCPDHGFEPEYLDPRSGHLSDIHDFFTRSPTTAPLAAIAMPGSATCYVSIVQELLETLPAHYGFNAPIASMLSDIRGGAFRFALEDGHGIIAMSIALTPGHDHGWTSLLLDAAMAELNGRLEWELDESNPDLPELHIVATYPEAGLPEGEDVMFGDPVEVSGWNLWSDSQAIATLAHPLQLPSGIDGVYARSIRHDGYTLAGLSTTTVPDWDLPTSEFTPSPLPSLPVFCEEHRVISLSILLEYWSMIAASERASVVESVVADLMSSASICGDDPGAVEAAWASTIEGLRSPLSSDDVDPTLSGERQAQDPGRENLHYEEGMPTPDEQLEGEADVIRIEE